MTGSELPEWVHWVSALSPLGTSLVALSAAGVAGFTLRQRREADGRQHWWDRTKWAIERAQDHEDASARRVALDILDLQAKSRLANKPELEIIDAIQEPILGKYYERSATDIGSASGYVVQETLDVAEGGAGDVDER